VLPRVPGEVEHLPGITVAHNIRIRMLHSAGSLTRTTGASHTYSINTVAKGLFQFNFSLIEYLASECCFLYNFFFPSLSVGRSYTTGSGLSGHIEYDVWGCRPTPTGRGAAPYRYNEELT